MARPKKDSVKGNGTAVRLEPEEKLYLMEGAKLESPPGTEMGLSTYLRTAAHVRTAERTGMTFEQWKAKAAKAKRKDGR